METIRKGYPELLKKIDASRMSFLHEGTYKSIWEASPEEREAFWEFLYAQPGFGFWVSNYKEVLMDRNANALLSDFIAKKIRQRVKDPWTADKLTPKTHGESLPIVPCESDELVLISCRFWTTTSANGDSLLRGLQPTKCTTCGYPRNSHRVHHGGRCEDVPRACQTRLHHIRHRIFCE